MSVPSFPPSRRPKAPSPAPAVTEAAWTPLRPIAPLSLGRTTSLVSAADAPLALVDHSRLSVSTLRDTGWQSASLSTSPPAFHGPHDDRHTAFASASGGAIYELDAEGGLWRAAPGGLLEQVATAAQGPGPRCTGYHALAHDVLHRRLVLFGGSERNDTWLFDEDSRTWRELLSTPRPPHGPGGLCATHNGVYLYVDHQLWRLHAERWDCMGHDPDWMACVLFHDPSRRVLWSASGDRLATWQQGKFLPVVSLPAGVSICPYPFDPSSQVGLDKLCDRLIARSPRGAHQLSLSSLGEAALGELPVQACEPPTRRLSPPPPEALRTAARFAPRKDAPAVRSVPGVRVPVGYRLLAVVPSHPRILPLPAGVTGLAVMVPEESFEAYEHTRVVQLKGTSSPGLWLRDGGVLRPCESLEHQEIDPDQQHHLDTLPGHQFDHACATKFGGFGRFVQDDPAPRCTTCQGPMRFAMQLGHEVFMVGDMGETYAFFCPRGCGASAVLQTH